MTHTIGLVACSATKLDHAAPAGELYTSQLFTKSKAYVARHADEWFILSAKHHLVHPDTVLEPYNMRLGKTRREPGFEPSPPIWGWAKKVASALDRHVVDHAGGWGNVELLVLAGETYRPFLTMMPGVKYTMPLAGMGIGQQLAFLKVVRDPSLRYCEAHDRPFRTTDGDMFACPAGCEEFAPFWPRRTDGVALKDVTSVS